MIPLLAAGPRAEQSSCEPARIVLLGDSLTAGTGLDAGWAYPDRLRTFIDTQRWPRPPEIVVVARAGWTTAAGVAALPQVLGERPSLLIVALGANDGLRAIGPDDIESNLDAIVRGALAVGAAVVLVGMEALPLHGTAYVDAFRAAFQAVAVRYPIGFIPFLLEGVALREDLNQADGLHPNAEGALRVAEHLWEQLKPTFRFYGGPCGPPPAAS